MIIFALLIYQIRSIFSLKKKLPNKTEGQTEKSYMEWKNETNRKLKEWAEANGDLDYDQIVKTNSENNKTKDASEIKGVLGRPPPGSAYWKNREANEKIRAWAKANGITDYDEVDGGKPSNSQSVPGKRFLFTCLIIS
jgi:hypothetical protein